MIFSQPIFEETRFDKNLSLLKKVTAGIKTDYSLGLGKGSDVNHPYLIEFKLSIILCAGPVENVIVAYTAAAQANIIEVEAPEKDSSNLQHFMFDSFNLCKKRITSVIPELDLSNVQKPDYVDLSGKMINALIERGFYANDMRFYRGNTKSKI